MKISKAESKKHDEALAVLSLTRALTQDDIEFVYENYNPMAEHNVGKGGIFFTPLEMAREFCIYAHGDGDVIDLAAGIGVLSYKALLQHRSGRNSTEKPRRHVAIELASTFVEIGRKLVPEIEWIEGDIFDQDLLRSLGTFDYAISNPPFGQVITKKSADWMLTKGPAQNLTIEVMARLCWGGGYIIAPDNMADYDLERRKYREPKVGEQFKHFPGISFQIIPTMYEEYDKAWKGANPRARIIDVNFDEVTFERPYGFRDIQEKLL